MEKKAEAETTRAETTRYENLHILLKVFFIFSTVVGVGLAVFMVFGFNVRGFVFLNIGYYYLLFGLFGAIFFLIVPGRKKDKKLPWYDLGIAALILGMSIYFYFNSHTIAYVGWVPSTTFNYILAFIYLIIILEGARRAAGPIYALVCFLMGIYPLVSGYMPGTFEGINFPLTRVVCSYIFGGEGIIGLPGKVFGDLLIGFLVFAGILIACGAGEFFLDLAQALVGKYRGGPAKVAVVASGFFGSLSGSALANVVATGSITIPAMKRMGYPAEYAGGIEACASTGGTFMPPVMGGGVFIMCYVTGIPYFVVMAAVTIPAILYYFGLLMQVDAYAARTGLKGLPQEELVPIKKTLRWGWPFLTVILFLVWGLVYMRWEFMTPFYASVLLLLLSFTNRRLLPTPRRLLGTIVGVGKLLSQMVIIFIPLGIIMSALQQTGASAAIVGMVVGLGGENVILILLLGVIISFLLGMIGLLGAAYLFLSITMAPAVISIAKLDVLAVHMFLWYYAALSVITLPVAAAAFVAAGIARAEPMKTAWRAMRLGIVIYFIPFFFVFNPALIMRGPLLETLYLFVLCLIGITLIAAGLEGYLLKAGRIGWWARPFLIVAGFLIAYPEWITTYIGAALALLVLALILRGRKMVVGGAERAHS